MEEEKYGLKRSVSVSSRLINATRYSLQGLKTTYNKEQAFRFQFRCFLVGIPLAFFVAKTPLGIFLLLFSIIFVMIVELLNTGIEMIVDRVGIEHNQLSGQSKDAASAAVFLSILCAGSFWIFVFFTNIL
jgi:diacylglycerol kinase (ATP)